MLKLDRIFSSIKDFSGLKIDTVLVEEQQPILFTCTDSKHNVYLALCPFDDAKHIMWYLTKTNYDVLIDLLKDKITIYDAFKAVSNKKYIIIYNIDGVSSKCVPFEALDERFLPVKGEYMDTEDDEFCDEIRAFHERKQTKYIIYYIMKPETRTATIPIQCDTYKKYRDNFNKKSYAVKERIPCPV